MEYELEDTNLNAARPFRLAEGLAHMQDLLLTLSPLLSIPLTFVSWMIVHAIAEHGTQISFLGITYTKRKYTGHRWAAIASKVQKITNRLRGHPEARNSGAYSATANANRCGDQSGIRWVQRWKRYIHSFPDGHRQLNQLQVLFLLFGSIAGIVFVIEPTNNPVFLVQMTGCYAGFLVTYVVTKLTFPNR